MCPWYHSCCRGGPRPQLLIDPLDITACRSGSMNPPRRLARTNSSSLASSEP